MKKISKDITLALLLSAASLAHASTTTMSDQDLSDVRGTDGFTMMGDLHINTGSFVYTDTDANGGSVALNQISIHGMYARRYDILRGATMAGTSTVTDANTSGTFANSVAQSMQAYLGESGAVTAGSQTAQQMNQAVAAGVYTGGDVIQVAFPNVGFSSNVTPTFTVSSVTTGGSTASFGSFTLEKIDMQGTKRWMWSH